MDESHEEYEDSIDNMIEEILQDLVPLNLPLVKTPQLMMMMLSIISEPEECPNPNLTTLFGSTENTRTTHEKTKAMSFPISKITIGEWTRTAEYITDLTAKFYFAKKKLLWEILDNVETERGVSRLKKKIEISWSDVLSLRCFISHDEGVLEIELSKPPTFFMETNPIAGKHTQWKEIDQDFTQEQSASRFRRHKLHFAPGVLEKNFEKLVTEDNFWSELAKVNFPTLGNSLYFDNGNSNNNGNSQGFDHRSVRDIMETQFCPNDTVNQLPETQVNMSYHGVGFFSESELNNPLMMQEDNQMRIIRESRECQVNTPAPYFETQTNSILQDMNEHSTYPYFGPYLQSLLVAEEVERQNMKHTDTVLNGSDNIYSNDHTFDENIGLLPPDL